MLSMGPILDLAALKMAFASLVRHAEPNILSSFMLWVDLSVSEFKVTGTLPPTLKMGMYIIYDLWNTWICLGFKCYFVLFKTHECRYGDSCVMWCYVQIVLFTIELCFREKSFLVSQTTLGESLHIFAEQIISAVHWCFALKLFIYKYLIFFCMVDVFESVTCL